MSARLNLTVLARNFHRFHPYGLIRVTSRHVTGTTTSADIGARSSGGPNSSNADHIPRTPRPTIQPPCMLAQRRNITGSQYRVFHEPVRILQVSVKNKRVH